MIVISDSSPIINLSAIGHIRLLKDLYSEIIIPKAVYEEINSAMADEPGVAEVRTLPWILQHEIENTALVKALNLELDLGESQAIACALEMKADLLLMDEHIGRRVAKRFGIQITGILGILVEAKRKKLITKVKPLLSDLKNRVGFWIADDLYHRVLKQADEQEGNKDR